MKLQNGTQVKQTQQNILFYLSCSVLEINMNSNTVKLENARNWQKRLGNSNPVDVIRKAPETVGEDVCNASSLGEIAKTPVLRMAENPAEEKLERLLKDVKGTFKLVSLQGSGSALCLKTSTRNLHL